VHGAKADFRAYSYTSPDALLCENKISKTLACLSKTNERSYIMDCDVEKDLDKNFLGQSGYRARRGEREISWGLFTQDRESREILD